MKKIILTLVCAMTSLFASAQAKTFSAGVNVNYGTQIETFGIGAKGAYCFTDAIRGEASFNYFFPNDGFSMWEINANAHYLFKLSDKFKVYPLVGLTYVHAHWSMKDVLGEDDWGWGAPMKKEVSYDDIDISDGGISYNEGRFGVNLGGGVQFDVTQNIVLNFEVKYSLVKDFDQCVLGIGAAYKF